MKSKVARILRRIVFAIGLIAGFFLFANAQIANAQSNLVPNSSFEEGVAGTPAGWVYWGNQAASSKRDWTSTMAHTGFRSVSISDVVEYSGIGGWAGYETRDFIPIIAGISYETSIWYYQSERSTEFAYDILIQTEFYDNNGNFITGIYKPPCATPVGQWYQHSYTWIAPEGATQIKIMIHVNGSTPPSRTAAYFDDVSVIADYPEATVRVSYTTGGQQTVLGDFSTEIHKAIGNLSFSPGQRPLLVSGTANATANTFEVKLALRNDGMAGGYIVTGPFQLSGDHCLSGSIRAEILTSDARVDDNVLEQDFTVWWANFKYARDNYQFSNWAATYSEVTEICNAYFRKYGLLYLVFPVQIVQLIDGWCSTSGHCAGLATTSIIYHDQPGLIPDGQPYTYRLTKTQKVLDNIRIAFDRDIDATLTAMGRDVGLGGSLQEISKLSLERVKAYLSANTLVSSNFSKHTTVTHTMIQQNKRFDLFDYDNNPGVSSSPQFRSYFTESDDGSVLHSSGDRAMYFEYPPFGLGKINAGRSFVTIPESTLTRVQRAAIDSLRIQQQDMIVLSVTESDTADTSTTETVELSDGIVPLRDYGRIKIYVYPNELKPSITLTTLKETAVSLMAISTRDTIARQVAFDNILIPAGGTKAIISQLFATEKTVCSLESQGGVQLPTVIPATFDGHAVLDFAAAPPTLVKPFPPIVLKTSVSESVINLAEYVSQDGSSDIGFEVKCDTALVRATVEGSILRIGRCTQNRCSTSISLRAFTGFSSSLFVLFVEMEASPNSILPSAAPKEFFLGDNYPNPFNPSTTIRYATPRRTRVLLTVYDILGQKVTELVNAEVEAGHHEVAFSSHNLASGVYFYRMQAEHFTQTKRLLLAR